jgi:Uma2 family endonuclease
VNRYEEIINGETLLRAAPGARHERICAVLHAAIGASLGENSAAKLLEPRSIVQLSPGTMLRPDLALVSAATGKLYMAAEIISSDDHRTDTVVKKALYEDTNIPRLWMIDPRYDNVEIYEGTAYGLALRGIIASRELIQDAVLPQLQLTVARLFAA